MTRDEAEWNRLERSHASLWSRFMQLRDVLVRLRTGECWCGCGTEPEMFSGHSSVCMEAQRLMEAYK